MQPQTDFDSQGFAIPLPTLHYTPIDWDAFVQLDVESPPPLPHNFSQDRVPKTPTPEPEPETHDPPAFTYSDSDSSTESIDSESTAMKPAFWDQSVPGHCPPRSLIWFANAGLNIATDVPHVKVFPRKDFTRNTVDAYLNCARAMEVGGRTEKDEFVKILCTAAKSCGSEPLKEPAIYALCERRGNPIWKWRTDLQELPHIYMWWKESGSL
ncbi:hypothetical protein BGZ60DRAFT_570464 [Tricladium varicosporioides]|nr:hypothetical protein BGZ60DRAFT_570464 [Hymenoscyphus varicosporioides]